MQPQEIGEFFTRVQKVADDNWSDCTVKHLANHAIPEGMLGDRGWLLRGDAAVTWGRWFVESIVDLAPYVAESERNIGHLHRAVLRHFEQMAPTSPKDERQEYAKPLTRFAWQIVLSRRSRVREPINAALREAIWSDSQPDPRCYLCGYQFTSQARDKFLGLSREVPPVPRFVDFTRPRGLRSPHLQIEVDHVIPVADGGQTGIENLRLACGWCNSTKNRFSNIYDSAQWFYGAFSHPLLGPVTIPQPLWILRTVATRKRCEFSAGCSARIENSELFGGPRNEFGALSPSNIAVYCPEHDPWKDKRWVGPGRLRSSMTSSSR
ncbi:HNH endonuclease [Kitasatospora sp. NPDC101157]|uniref:HNH endonuclease n=1 Tax=Kitasatospora sp. NPDC101157 TaxID=3364098 RepID=UPI0037F222FB